MDCLENIVGLTATECTCYDGEKPSGFDTDNVSTSGLYVTDAADGFPLISGVYHSLDCDRADNVFQAIKNARSQAIASLLTDVPATRADMRKSAEGFSGFIGRLKMKGYATVGKQYAGQLIRGHQVRGRSFELESVHVGFLNAHTTDVTVVSDNPKFTPQTVSVTNLAGKYGSAAFPTPVSLDFSDEYTYAVYYDATDRRPIKNDYTCCGHKEDYLTYLRPGGFTSDDPQGDLKDCLNMSRCDHPYGLVLEGYVACGDNDWICNPERYGLPHMTRVIAKTIQFKAAANLIQFVLDSDSINAYTLLKREDLYRKHNSRLKAYEDNVNHLAYNSPKSGCTGCEKPKIQMSRVSLV